MSITLMLLLQMSLKQSWGCPRKPLASGQFPIQNIQNLPISRLLLPGVSSSGCRPGQSFIIIDQRLPMESSLSIPPMLFKGKVKSSVYIFYISHLQVMKYFKVKPLSAWESPNIFGKGKTRKATSLREGKLWISKQRGDNEQSFHYFHKKSWQFKNKVNLKMSIYVSTKIWRREKWVQACLKTKKRNTFPIPTWSSTVLPSCMTVE